jgi:hypothetical protein
MRPIAIAEASQFSDGLVAGAHPADDLVKGVLGVDPG